MMLQLMYKVNIAAAHKKSALDSIPFLREAGIVAQLHNLG